MCCDVPRVVISSTVNGLRYTSDRQRGHDCGYYAEADVGVGNTGDQARRAGPRAGFWREERRAGTRHLLRDVCRANLYLDGCSSCGAMGCPNWAQLRHRSRAGQHLKRCPAVIRKMLQCLERTCTGEISGLQSVVLEHFLCFWNTSCLGGQFPVLRWLKGPRLAASSQYVMVGIWARHCPRRPHPYLQRNYFLHPAGAPAAPSYLQCATH